MAIFPGEVELHCPMCKAALSVKIRCDYPDGPHRPVITFDSAEVRVHVEAHRSEGVDG